MPSTKQTTDQQFQEAKAALDATLARNELPSCALDEQGVQEQQARHQRLAPSVTNLERPGETVVFTFSEDYDRQALLEMVTVEERCCPFFRFALEEGSRQLTVGVRDEEMLPALEAIASHLGARWEEKQEQPS
jgi:hypothetical protein